MSCLQRGEGVISIGGALDAALYSEQTGHIVSICISLYFILAFATEFVGLFNPILERVNVSATHNSHKARPSLAFQVN